MRYKIYRLDMYQDGDGAWVENDRLPLGTLDIDGDIESLTDVSILAALARFSFQDCVGRSIHVINTTDRRRIYAEDLYGDGTWWEVGEVKGHMPTYGLELLNAENR